MEVVTIDSRAFRELEAKINSIAEYVVNSKANEQVNEDEIWVDSLEVCSYLLISDKTLQRLRKSGDLAFSNIRGRYFYKIAEIKRMLENKQIKSTQENLRTLITNHRLNVEERRNSRKNR